MNDFDIEIMIKENSELVDYTIRTYFPSIVFNYSDIYDDLKQIGLVALSKSITTFDESRGFKFSTYAINNIKNAVSNFIRLDLYRYVNKHGVVSLNSKLDGRNEDTVEIIDTIGVYDDYGNIETNYIIEFMTKKYKRDFELNVVDLLSKGNTYQVIADTLGVTKQYVGLVVAKIRKDIIKDLKVSI